MYTLQIQDSSNADLLSRREKTRQALMARDMKIVKLQQRVAGLQGDVESGKTVVKHLRRTIEDQNQALKNNTKS